MLPTCLTPLPMDLTQRLSDYEFLCFVVGKMNSIIDHFNAIDELIDKKMKEQRDEIYAHVNQQLNDFNKAITAELNVFKTDVNNQIIGLTKTVNDAITEMENALNMQVQLIYKLISENNIWVRQYVSLEIYRLKEELKCDIFPVINPISMERENLQNVLYALYNTLRYGALTAKEYDLKYLTAEEFDKWGLTAFEYDLYAAWMFPEMLNTMYSPFTGERVKESTVIYNLSELHQENYTANGFDNLNLTALAFDTKNITAYDYDWTNLIGG